MDQEVARTLGELERKLLELERTLHGISAGVAPNADNSEATVRSPSPPDTGAGASTAVPAGSTRPSSPAWSRIVDETFERPSPASPSLAPARLTFQPPPSASSGTSATVSSPPSAAPPPPPSTAPPAPPPAAPPPAPRAPAPPSAAELLRFRERLEQAARDLTHDYDELLGRLSYRAVPTTTRTSTISFARGAPSLDIVDVDGLRDAAVRAFDSDPAGTTAYGTSVGYPRLRSWIADRHGVEPERVLVTNGSMQADAFLFEQLVRPGDEVIVERPTYDRTLLSLRQRGARVHAVQLQPDGIDTEELEQLLTSTSGGPAQPTLAHIIPNFQNPAGYTLSYEKRRRLLELAADHGFIVFEDDPYVELRFSGETLPTMLSIDPERVVYASSFSKTVCPGIRVGYLVGPADLIGTIVKRIENIYISPNMVAESIVYRFCKSGAIDRSIETVRSALAERVKILGEALRTHIPEAQFAEPEGGYFMWVTLDEGTDVAALFEAAKQRGVAFVKGTDFLLEGGENTLRLAYSGVTADEIEEGVSRLAQALHEVRNATPATA
jgi:2-aminoadipate transaminase